MSKKLILRFLIINFVFLVISACSSVSVAESFVTTVPFATRTTIYETPAPTKSPATPKPTVRVVTDTPTVTFQPTEIVLPTKTPLSLPAVYEVVEGDTLADISREYRVPIGLIALVNNIENINYIYSGQILYIPDPNKLSDEFLANGKKIVVFLQLQEVYAFEDGKLVNKFIVSTGLPETPTLPGLFKIYKKVESMRMTGDGYDLPDVPWVMFFVAGYSFHGTYWHENFGQPMSHGCVNMRMEDAKWLYDWAPVGTFVKVIP